MLAHEPPVTREIKAVLQRFQAGYTARRVEALDAFMADLFAPDDDLLVIGTGSDEWCRGHAAVRALLESDWRYWGDVRLSVDEAEVGTEGAAAWVAVPGTVTMTMDPETVNRNHLEAIRRTLEAEIGARDKLLEIIRGAGNTLFESERGPTYIWPFRFTGVLVRQDGRWLFRQIQFSFPTTRFPDERITQP